MILSDVPCFGYSLLQTSSGTILKKHSSETIAKDKTFRTTDGPASTVSVDHGAVKRSQTRSLKKCLDNKTSQPQTQISASYFTHEESRGNPWFRKHQIKQQQQSPPKTTFCHGYTIKKTSTLWAYHSKTPVQTSLTMSHTPMAAVSGSPSLLSLCRSDSLLSQPYVDSIDVSEACSPAILCQASSANVSFDITEWPDILSEADLTQQHWSVRAKTTPRNQCSSSMILTRSQSSPVIRQSSLHQVNILKSTSPLQYSKIKTAPQPAFQRTVLPVNTSWQV